MKFAVSIIVIICCLNLSVAKNVENIENIVGISDKIVSGQQFYRGIFLVHPSNFIQN